LKSAIPVFLFFFFSNKGRQLHNRLGNAMPFANYARYELGAADHAICLLTLPYLACQA